ncbi:MAG: leucine-rich repeat domain-containing protein [Thermoguttaceae bacterium]|nr:leucine-rich repeat domain-containing protein [Thermoguttaceae bacterium]
MWGQMATGGKVLILGMVVVLAGDGASRDPLAKAEAGQPLPPEIIQARQHPPDTYTSGAPRKPVSPYVLESWRRRSIREGWMGMVEGRLLPFAPTKEKLLEGLPMDLRMKVKTFPAFRVRFLLDGVEVKEWWLFPPPFAPFFGLDLSYTTIRDENLLKELAGFEKLDVLELRRTEITDAGLEHLAGLKLKNLTIPDQAKTDLGLKHYLAALEEPKELDLRLWKITDAGLAHLAGLKNLQVLNLWNTRITDAGLEHLAGLKNLQVLDLSFTQITNAGLEKLVELENLQELDVTGTNIRKTTDVGYQKLKKAVPNCKIKIK